MISLEDVKRVSIIRMGDTKVIGVVVETGGANQVAVKDALHFKEVNKNTLMKWIQAKNLGELKTITLYNQMFTTEDLSVKSQLAFEHLVRLFTRANDIAEDKMVNQVFEDLCTEE